MNPTKPIAIVDTDVASNLLKGSSIGCEYFGLLYGYQAAVASVTAGELLFGASGDARQGFPGHARAPDHHRV